MIERLKEARDAKSNLEEGFRQEVRAQTRLAELHQKQASDAEEKSQKLTAAITGKYFFKICIFCSFYACAMYVLTYQKFRKICIRKKSSDTEEKS